MLGITYYGDMTISGSPAAHPARPSRRPPMTPGRGWSRYASGVVREHFVRTVSLASTCRSPRRRRCAVWTWPPAADGRGRRAAEVRPFEHHRRGRPAGARGLVERRAAPHDRRVKSLVLTEQGAALRERLSAQMFGAPAAIARSRSDDQQRLERSCSACSTPVAARSTSWPTAPRPASRRPDRDPQIFSIPCEPRLTPVCRVSLGLPTRGSGHLPAPDPLARDRDRDPDLSPRRPPTACRSAPRCRAASCA